MSLSFSFYIISPQKSIKIVFLFSLFVPLSDWSFVQYDSIWCACALVSGFYTFELNVNLVNRLIIVPKNRTCIWNIPYFKLPLINLSNMIDVTISIRVVFNWVYHNKSVYKSMVLFLRLLYDSFINVLSINNVYFISKTSTRNKLQDTLFLYWWKIKYYTAFHVIMQMTFFLITFEVLQISMKFKLYNVCWNM